MTKHDFGVLNAICSILHDGATLRVFYRSGGTYDYEDVSDELVTGLIHAENASRYILERIRPDRQSIPVVPGEPFPRLVWD